MWSTEPDLEEMAKEHKRVGKSRKVYSVLQIAFWQKNQTTLVSDLLNPESGGTTFSHNNHHRIYSFSNAQNFDYISYD